PNPSSRRTSERGCEPGCCAVVPRPEGRCDGGGYRLAGLRSSRQGAMNPLVDPRRVPRLVGVSWVASALAFAEGAVVLVGWQLDSPLLTSILPGRVAMNPVSALGFMLSAVALWLCLSPVSARGHGRGRVARVAAVSLASIGVVTLAGYAMGTNL